MELSHTYIKFVLLDAEQKQWQNYNFEIQNWLWRIRRVLSDAENVLDELEYKNLRKKVIKAHGGDVSSRSSIIITKVNSLISGSNPLAFRFRIAQKMKQINARFLND